MPRAPRSLVISVIALACACACLGAFVLLRADLSRARRRVPDSDPSTFTPRRGEPLVFGARCEPVAHEAVLGFMGDLLVHNAPHAQGLTDGFATLWQPMVPLWQAADLTYANLEGTLRSTPFAKPTGKAARKNRVAYDPRFADALKIAGFDIVSTANNHAADHGVPGIGKTLDVLDDAQLLHTGTRRSAQDDRGWHTITEVNGLTLAWVACTEWNNHDEPDGLVLHCHRQREQLLALVRALAPRVDAVIVTPHGGTEGRARPNAITRALQRELVEAGALLVVGNHPHTLQQWEKMTAQDGREAFVSSCSGAGFTRLKKPDERRFGAYLLVAVARGMDGVVRVREVRHVPYVWSRDSGRYQMEPAWGVRGSVRARAKVNKLLSADNELGSAAFERAPLELTDACATL